MAGKKKAEKENKAQIRREKKAQRKEIHLEEYDDSNELNNQLLGLDLSLKIIPGDGNCLFRALGDQLDGNIHEHMLHRQDVVQFMTDNRDDFEPFVEDDISFDEHIRNLSESGTFGGNDSIVAFSRLHDLTVVIHQLNKPLWQVHSEGVNRNKELHISYHNGDHYNSVRKSDDVNGTGPGNVHLSRLHRKSSSHNVVASSNPYENDDNEESGDEKSSKTPNFEASSKQNADQRRNVDLWSQNGTGSRILGNQMIESCDRSNVPQPARKLSARQQKDLKRKQRRLEKHTVKKSPSAQDLEENVELELTTNLQTLTI